MSWEGKSDRFSSSFKKKKKKEVIVDFDLFSFNIFHSEGKHCLCNCRVDVKCNTVFINHGVLDVCKFTLIFITCHSYVAREAVYLSSECAKLDRRLPVLSASVSSRNTVRKTLCCFNTSSFNFAWNGGVRGSEQTQS